MGVKIDLTGQRFGRLTVVRLGEFRNHAYQWVCKCDCGNVAEASASHLKSGHTKSCGCLRREGGKEVRDLTGQRFGKLVALKEDGRTKQGQAKWLCQCDCGNITSVASSSLTGGLTKSCGCYNVEKTTERNLKHGDAFRHNKTRLYEVWCAMIKRCENSGDHNYKYYGARGIRVADEWHDFSHLKSGHIKTGMTKQPRGTIARLTASMWMATMSQATAVGQIGKRR